MLERSIFAGLLGEKAGKQALARLFGTFRCAALCPNSMVTLLLFICTAFSLGPLVVQTMV